MALGDYIDSTSTNSALEGSFATAGLVSTGGGNFDVHVSVFKTDTTVSPMVPVWQCSASCGLSVPINDSDVRLFAYPGLDFSSTGKAIVVVVNDYLSGSGRLHFYMFNWDYSVSPTSITNIASTTTTTASTVTDNIKYTGQHDIFYLPTSNSLFLLRKDGVLEEIFINPPSSTISATTSLSNITAVAYKDDISTSVFVTTDTSGNLNTYVNTIGGGVVSSVSSIIPSPLTAFDGCYNKTVDTTGFYFCAVDSGSLISYRFEVDSSGFYTTSNSYGTTFLTLRTWTQVETQAYNVINVGVGPNNTSGVRTARVVCDSTTLRPTYSEYDNAIISATVEDFILMRHPSGSDNSINNNSASGSNHLICIDESLTITTHGKNFLNEVENDTSTNGTPQRQQYIIYLGYCYNSATSAVNYLYLALASNSVVTYDPSGGSTGGGYYLYFNYDA